MKKELWLRLRNYHFDDLVPPHLADRVRSVFAGSNASTCAFASKLARKHKWTERNALRAIEEYKKFVYLGVTNLTPVTPPKIIDTVWHEHILFSRAYREFCDSVLHRPFDHNPELLPTSEQTDVFEAQFEETLDAYEREFRVPPPVDIWGTPKFKRERRHQDSGDISATYVDDGSVPLYMLFDSSDTGGDANSMAEFAGGGGFSGGGGGNSWGSDSTSTDSGSSADSGGSSDAGSSCGSGCSSSCGGGGCSS